MDNPFDITKTAEYQLGRLEARVRLALDYIDKWEPWGKEDFFARETLRSILTGDETLPQSDAQ